MRGSIPPFVGAAPVPSWRYAEGFVLMLELKDRKVLVLGLGDTGLSMARWLVHQGADVRVADSRNAPPRAAALRGELPQVPVDRGAFHEGTLAGAELIALSPGIDRRDPTIANAIRRGVPVVGDIELFAQALSALPRRPRVLAITGSNGKSTVTAMTGTLCRAAGAATAVAGNIGPPALDALPEEASGVLPDVFVLELSSFQLESTSSLQCDAAAMLNVCEDHMDRYHDLDEYAAAKARIFLHCAVQVLNRDDPRSLGMARRDGVVTTFGLDAPRNENDWGLVQADRAAMLACGSRMLAGVDELPLNGLHNAANALAALALVRAIDLPEAPLVGALRTFRGLPHRMQHIDEVNGVAFYDDSKGTNVGATIAALSGLPRRAVLIAGGDGKGQDFTPLAGAVRRHARHVVLIGRDADRIAEALVHCGVPMLRASSMEEAVEAAYRAARPGDAVLLSPACASYDMFRDYVDRGQAFARAVAAVASRAAHAARTGGA